MIHINFKIELKDYRMSTDNTLIQIKIKKTPANLPTLTLKTRNLMFVSVNRSLKM